MASYVQSLAVTPSLLQMSASEGVDAPAAYYGLRQAPVLSISPSFVLTVVGVVALSAGAAVFVLTFLFGGRFAKRAFGVVMMGEEDYPQVQEEVRLVSSRLGLASPKVGLVEDLRPNAFSLGRGKGATVVFSLGLLNVLAGEELEAVISHELAHIKNGDSTFKALTNALVAISFFNPLSYLTASAAMKEREMLADERGASVIGTPHALASALVKVGRALREFPPERRLTRLAAATFLVSSFDRHTSIRSYHPSVEARAWNLLEMNSKSIVPRRRVAAAVLLSSMVLLGGVAASLYFVNLQAHLLQILLPKAPTSFVYASQPNAPQVGLASHAGARFSFPRFRPKDSGSAKELKFVKPGHCQLSHPASSV